MQHPASSDNDPVTEPPQFRVLRRLVTILTATLIIGVLTIAGTLVIRILMENGPAPVTSIEASEVTIPSDEDIIATGATASALTIVTRSSDGEERLRVFHPKTGEEVGQTVIRRAE